MFEDPKSGQRGLVVVGEGARDMRGSGKRGTGSPVCKKEGSEGF